MLGGDAAGALHPQPGAVHRRGQLGSVHAGNRGYDRQISGQVQLDGQDAAVFVTAYATDDTQTQRDLLGEHITAQVFPDWGGQPGRTMTVTVIEAIRIHD